MTVETQQQHPNHDPPQQLEDHVQPDTDTSPLPSHYCARHHFHVSGGQRLRSCGPSECPNLRACMRACDNTPECEGFDFLVDGHPCELRTRYQNDLESPVSDHGWTTVHNTAKVPTGVSCSPPSLTAFAAHRSQDEVAHTCSKHMELVSDVSMAAAFEHYWGPGNAGIVVAREEDMLIGVCESTFVIKANVVYQHARSGTKMVHREKFNNLCDLLEHVRSVLHTDLPEIIFNFHSQDNPECVQTRKHPPYPPGVIMSCVCPLKDKCPLGIPLSCSNNQQPAWMSTKVLQHAFATTPWENKQSVAAWRGGRTGYAIKSKEFDKSYRYGQTPRQLLVGKSRSPLVDASWTKTPMTELFSRFKYGIAVEGNSYSGNLKEIIASKCMPIKPPIRCTEWYVPFLKPNVHFLPVKYDFSDLVERVQWAKDHDDEAKRIAMESRAFALRMFKRPTIMCAHFLSLLEFKKRLQFEIRVPQGSTEVRRVQRYLYREPDGVGQSGFECDSTHCWIKPPKKKKP